LFGWPQAVDGFLRAHGLASAAAPALIARQHNPIAALRPSVPSGSSSRVWAHRTGDAPA
jgi:alpha-1,6-mannosyltransferase